MNQIFGGESNPYYFWAPRWIDASAGIRALHYLCHSLNSSGAHAFLVLAEPPVNGEPRVNPNLNTPILSQEVVDSHVRIGRAPIAVYAEDVIGNPLNAPTVVRFLWNYSAALGGPLVFDEDEMVFAFSQSIARRYAELGRPKPGVLFVPPVNPSEFEFTSEKKGFQVVYAGKYRSFVGKPHSVGNLPSVEIFRDGPQKQDRIEVKRLLSEAEVVYSFENSSIVTEAILSGTPAGFIPNKFFDGYIAESELGMGGAFIGEDPIGISRARETLHEGVASYLKTIEDFPTALQEFYLATQTSSAKVRHMSSIRIPKFKYSGNPIGASVTTSRIAIGWHILRSKGTRVFLREVFRFVRNRI